LSDKKTKKQFEGDFPFASFEECVNEMGDEVGDAEAFCASWYMDTHGVHPAEDKSIEKKAYSREYLESMLEKLREMLPKWLYDEIHREALPSSGGKSRNNREAKQNPTSSQVHVERPLEIERERYKKDTYSKIIKAEKQLVYGIVLEPDTKDLQGDIISAPEIEKTAHRYMMTSQTLGDMHEGIMTEAEIVESFIAPVDYELDGEPVKKGSWVMVIKIHDALLWQDVKGEKYNGLSIGAYARRIPREED